MNVRLVATSRASLRRPVTRLAQNEEPAAPGGEAAGGGRLEGKVAVKENALILKRAKLSCPSGQWQDEDYDVLADGVKDAEAGS